MKKTFLFLFAVTSASAFSRIGISSGYGFATTSMQSNMSDKLFVQTAASQENVGYRSYPELSTGVATQPEFSLRLFIPFRIIKNLIPLFFSEIGFSSTWILPQNSRVLSENTNLSVYDNNQVEATDLTFPVTVTVNHRFSLFLLESFWRMNYKKAFTRFQFRPFAEVGFGFGLSQMSQRWQIQSSTLTENLTSGTATFQYQHNGLMSVANAPTMQARFSVGSAYLFANRIRLSLSLEYRMLFIFGSADWESYAKVQENDLTRNSFVLSPIYQNTDFNVLYHHFAIVLSADYSFTAVEKKNVP